ncbi:hypothetical protein [Nocardia carnea]|uniref:hypothetical protein n=1 Tax=Nocardia carnea TaxID=37328 RepID=UPI0024555ACD|nr:hypothetical protein [Nocardia carnea]
MTTSAISTAWRVEAMCVRMKAAPRATSNGSRPTEFVTHFSDIGGEHGGYNKDHEYYGYRPYEATSGT